MSGRITGKQIKDESLTGADILDDSLTGDDIDESTLIITQLRDTDGDTKIQLEEGTDEDKIRFDTAGTERMIIDDVGNVGVGTSDPQKDLEVYADADTRVRVTATASNKPGIEFADYSTTASPTSVYINNLSQQQTIEAILDLFAGDSRFNSWNVPSSVTYNDPASGGDGSYQFNVIAPANGTQYNFTNTNYVPGSSGNGEIFFHKSNGTLNSKAFVRVQVMGNYHTITDNTTTSVFSVDTDGSGGTEAFSLTIRTISGTSSSSWASASTPTHTLKWSIYNDNATSDSLKIESAADVAMLVSQDGKVGLGDFTQPGDIGAMFHIQGNAGGTGNDAVLRLEDTTHVPTIESIVSSGSLGSESALAAGDVVFKIEPYGADDNVGMNNSFGYRKWSQIKTVIANNTSAADNEGHIQLGVCDNNDIEPILDIHKDGLLIRDQYTNPIGDGGRSLETPNAYINFTNVDANSTIRNGTPVYGESGFGFAMRDGDMYFKDADDSDWTELGSLEGLSDADGDTYIDPEQSADDDVLRFYSAGYQKMTVSNEYAIDMFDDVAIHDSELRVTEDTDSDDSVGANIVLERKDTRLVAGPSFEHSVSDGTHIGSISWETVGTQVNPTYANQLTTAIEQKVTKEGNTASGGYPTGLMTFSVGAYQPHADPNAITPRLEEILKIGDDGTFTGTHLVHFSKVSAPMYLESSIMGQSSDARIELIFDDTENDITQGPLIFQREGHSPKIGMGTTTNTDRFGFFYKSGTGDPTDSLLEFHIGSNITRGITINPESKDNQDFEIKTDNTGLQASVGHFKVDTSSDRTTIYGVGSGTGASNIYTTGDSSVGGFGFNDDYFDNTTYNETDWAGNTRTPAGFEPFRVYADTKRGAAATFYNAFRNESTKDNFSKGVRIITGKVVHRKATYYADDRPTTYTYYKNDENNIWLSFEAKGMSSSTDISSQGSAVGTYSNNSSEPAVGYFETIGSVRGDDNYGLELDGITFTGKHDVASKVENIPLGYIIESTGDIWMGEGYDCALPYVRVSDKPKSKTVFGVVNDSKFKSQRGLMLASDDYPYQVNSVGEGRLWVTNINGDCTNGDYITSSIIPGYGQLQLDDILHSYTVAKLTENIDWSQITDTIEHDGTMYKRCLVACTYHCG